MNDAVENPIQNLSLYRFENFFKIFNDDDNKILFYNILKNISIFPANDDSIDSDYYIKYGDSWSFISYKNYNTTDLWWLVCEYNQIKNPIKFPEPGTKIKILKQSYVYTVLKEFDLQLNR